MKKKEEAIKGLQTELASLNKEITELKNENEELAMDYGRK